MINQVYFEITKKCNLSCIYCSNSMQSDTELTMSQIIKLLNDISEIGIKYLRLYGGEPLMSENLVPILKNASQLNLKTSIYSNGLLLDDILIKNIRKYNVHKVLISCDTDRFDKSIKYASKKLMKNINLLIESNIKVDVIITISKLNQNNIRSLYHKMYKAGVDSVKTSFVLKMGRACENWNDIYLDKIALLNTIKTVTELELKYKQTNLKSRKCNAAVEEIFISSNGNVYPCPLFQFDEFIGGNILDQNLKKIIEYPSSGFEKIKNLNLNNTSCRNCDIQSDCMSGCRAATYATTNSLLAPNLVSCLVNNKI